MTKNKGRFLAAVKRIHDDIEITDVKLLTGRMLQDEEFAKNFLKTVQLLFLFDPNLDNLIEETRLNVAANLLLDILKDKE